MRGRSNAPDTVLITAPIGADAANIRGVLQSAGLGARVCATTTELQAAIGNDCGAFVLTEEALTVELCEMLGRLFDAQPPWSDVPVVLITSGGLSNTGALAAAKLRGRGRTVTLLER